MELISESDIYFPSIDDNGIYIDRIPNFVNYSNGIKCQCGSRKDKVYTTYSKFSSHLNSKSHKKWIEAINLNRENYLVENFKLNNVIKQQRVQIAELEKNLHKRALTVDYLSNEIQKLTINNSVTEDLINLLN